MGWLPRLSWSNGRHEKGRPKDSAQKRLKISIGLNTDIDLPEHGSSESDFTVVSYGTRDGIYDKYLQRLAGSAESQNINVDTETIPACSANAATNFKPSFIKFKLLTLNKPIIWMDADAFIAGALNLPTGIWDIGLIKNTRNEKNPMASFIIAVKPSLASLRFLDVWENLCSTQIDLPGSDHIKMTYTRDILHNAYIEADLAESVRGSIIRDLGNQKEEKF